MEKQENTKSNDITLKELLNTLRVFGQQILRFWWVVLIGALVGGGIMGYNAHTTQPQYTAKLTFMLNEEGGQGISTALSSLLGRFSGGTAKYNLEKILALSKARVIIEKVLFAKTNIDGKEDFIGNHFIEIYKINEENKKKNKPEVYFENGNIDQFNENERFQLLNVYKLLVGPKGILSATINDKSGIMNLEIKTKNEILSIVTLDTLYDKLSQYYIDKSIEKEQITYNLLRRRVEQLYGQMNHQLTNAATLEDKTMGVWEQKTKLPQVKYERDTRISAILYGEALKNLELADFSLKTKTPFIQILDSPIAPLEVEESSIMKNVLLGAFLGFIIISIIIIVRKIVLTAIRS